MVVAGDTHFRSNSADKSEANRTQYAAVLQPIKTAESELEWNRCPVKMHRHFSLGPTGFLRVSDYTGPLISSAQLWKWSKLIEGNAECWDGYFNFNHCLIAATNDKFRWWMDTNGKWCWRKAMSKDKWLCCFWRCFGNLIKKVSRLRI